MTHIPFFQVDAFSAVPFKGNPAAICIPDEALPAELMQEIAKENNLAETAFVSKTADGFGLRWFTPTVEIKLCGHATLASAHILWEQGILTPGETARFHTKSGLLVVTRNDAWIQLDFPRFNHHSITAPQAMTRALHLAPLHAVCADDGRYIIEVASENEVLSCQPDFNVLKNFEVVVVTSRAADDSPYNFISRTFAPSHGVDEDSVTGSSHCALVPYWANKLQQNKLFARQASARGGDLRLTLAGDRVLIEGKAVTVIEGKLRVNA